MLPIIMNIADDDDRGFVERIYLDYEKKLKIISSFYITDDEDVNDCIQETIATVIENIDKFKLAHNNGYLDRLMPVVCRNCAMRIENASRLRHKNEQPLVRYNAAEEKYYDLELPDYNADVDKLYISEQNCAILQSLIDKLDPKYRDVILLKSLGLRTKAIAEIMQISEVMVRKRYSRAKKQLWEMGGKDLYVE